MRTVLIVPAVFFGWAAAGTGPVHAQRTAATVPAGPPLVIEHVTVVDVERGRLLPDRRVVVAGTRITVVDSGAGARPAGARVVDGRGKYLIPGLWDMHVHLTVPGAASVRVPLLLAHGVTGVRAMSQDCAGVDAAACAADPNTLDSVRVWRAAAVRGERLFPRLVASGPPIDGPRPTRARAFGAGTAAEGVAGVGLTRERGGDFVKVGSLVPRPAFFAALREARRLGLPVAGHVPAAVLPSEASDSGMASLEHNLGVWEECSTHSAGLLAQLDSIAAQGGPAAFARVSAFVTSAVMASLDPAHCDALFRRLARNGTWIVPTIVLRRGFAAQADDASRADPRLRYVPAAERASWELSNDFRTRALARGDFAARRERLRREPGLVARAHAAGVRVLAGSDLGNPYVFPGSSLHEELALLVEGGLTQLDAIRAATLNPARLLGATDSLGTVRPGKLADLVLLDADPVADIAHTRRIRAVVLNGRYLDRAALDALLAEAERAAKWEERPARP